MAKFDFEQYRNKKFNQLTVIGYLGEENGRHRLLTYCTCNKNHVTTAKKLRNGTKSCGCIQKEMYFRKQAVKRYQYLRPKI